MGQCVQVNALEQRERKHTYHNQDLIHTVIPYDEIEGQRYHLWIFLPLECEVKWALGSITMNNASGGDAIPVELFQILQMMQ